MSEAVHSTTAATARQLYGDAGRLLLFVEASIDAATEFAAYETNDERLWRRVETVVRRYLIGLWRVGLLAGVSPSEAFFVRIGRETMTDRDVRNGRLVIEVGVAPLRPAEFVVLRLFQGTLAPACRWC